MSGSAFAWIFVAMFVVKSWSPSYSIVMLFWLAQSAHEASSSVASVPVSGP